MFMTCRQNKSTAMLIQGSQHVMAQISCARDTWPTLTEQRTPSVPMLFKHMLFACFDSGRWLMPFRNRNARSGVCNRATHSMEQKEKDHIFSACIAHVSQIIQFLPVRYSFFPIWIKGSIRGASHLFFPVQLHTPCNPDLMLPTCWQRACGELNICCCDVHATINHLHICH